MSLVESGSRGSVGYWLGRLSDRVQQSFERRLAESGVTVAQCRVLVTVFGGHATTTSEVARFLATDPGAVSRLVDRLIAKGLMARCSHPNSRRRVDLLLTPTGRDLVPDLIHLAEENEHEFFGSLASSERAELLELLQRLLPISAKADGWERAEFRFDPAAQSASDGPRIVS